VTYIREPSMVERFASNACECISRTVHKKLLKCVIDVVASPFTISDKTHRPSAKRP